MMGGGWGGKGKGGKGGYRNISLVRRTAKSSPEKCVWIGGLAERETWKDAELNKELKDWIETKAPGVKFVDIDPKGRGGAIFGTDDEASAAISSCNGKKFQGKKLEFDVYVKGFKNDD